MRGGNLQEMLARKREAHLVYVFSLGEDLAEDFGGESQERSGAIRWHTQELFLFCLVPSIGITSSEVVLLDLAYLVRDDGWLPNTAIEAIIIPRVIHN